MNEDPKEFRRRRIEAGLSQTDLALKAGVSKSHISGVEQGRAGFSPKNLKAIADALDCTIRDLLLPDPETETSATTIASSLNSATTRKSKAGVAS